MTDNEITAGLQQLTIFGNLDEQEQIKGYLYALRDIPHNKFIRGVSWLIANYEKHRFPLPADIIRAAKDDHSETRDHKYDDTCDVPNGLDSGCALRGQRPCKHPCVRERLNAEFWTCFRLAGDLIPVRRRYYLEERLQQGPPADSEDTVSFYKLVAEEIQGELK